ncbi:MAG: protein kinase, partial [Chthoniobacteraceae bacterium]
MPGPIELDPTLSALAAGRRVFDRFVLVRILGRNQTGVSWLTQDDAAGRPAALRFLAESLARDLVALADVKLEIEALSALLHPAFAERYEFHQEGQMVAISREYVPGAPLGGLREVRLKGCYDADELLPLIEPLGAAFRHLHDEAKLVHRGLHPGHFVLTPDDEIRVVDCGIAHALLEASGRRGDGAPDGPLSAYASPQLASGHAPGPADDVHAFGAVLYDLLAGSPLKRSDGDKRTTIAEARAASNRWGEEVPAVWERVIAECMADDAARRPRRIADVIEQLRSGPG